MNRRILAAESLEVDMSVQERIRICIILEKARNNQEYAKKVGIEDKSKKGGK